MSPISCSVTVAATNIQGLGATQLLCSLLPALQRVGTPSLDTVWLPARGDAAYAPTGSSAVRVHHYARRLPNALSRVVECMTTGRRIARGDDLLVLGDLPYRHGARRQVVFVQTPFLLAGSRSASTITNLKSAISRALFRANLARIDQVVVQTTTMADGLLATYPELAGRITIIAQPAPAWLLATPPAPPPARAAGAPLRLFFPASPYPHKNHQLLGQALADCRDVASLDLTIADDATAVGNDPRIVRHGTLGPDAMIARYRACDALVFPSLQESYGLPLVEAMFLGLPVLAANLPYAHALCGDGAIYFDPNDPGALVAAIQTLRARLDASWRPDWTTQLAAIPRDWDEVARRMLALFAD